MNVKKRIIFLRFLLVLGNSCILYFFWIIFYKLALYVFIFFIVDIFVNILAIGAHPDDIELGCGGVVLKSVRQGHNVFMYTLTRGAASGNPDDRTRELITSASYIGAKKLWIDDFEDTKLCVNSELINRIENFINASDADVVFTHSLSDVHHDHKAIAASVVEAGRYTPNILAYEIPHTKDFNPQVFCDISDVVEEKVKLIKVFRTQRDKIYLKDNAIKGLAEYRALQSRLNGVTKNDTQVEDTDLIEAFRYVEAFEVLKLCLDREFKLSNVIHNYPIKTQIAISKTITDFYENPSI
jgi:LmbE family N-acetylglucosaminyl deacetylase